MNEQVGAAKPAPTPNKIDFGGGKAVETNADRAGRRYRDRSGPWARFKAYQAFSIVAVSIAFLLALVLWTLISGGEFKFFSYGNLSVLAQQIPITAIAAIGVGLLMISGEFDISIAGTFTLVAFVISISAGNLGMPMPVALLLGLAVAVVIGVINGLITCWLVIPSFIATIGMMFFLRGAVRFVSINPETNLPDSIAFFPSDGFKTLLTGHIGGPFSAQLVWLVLVACIGYLILNRHQLGNHMFTAGGNPNAAISIGVNVRRTKLIAFVICAVTAGFAGLLQATRINEIEPSYATISGLELKAIAAAVVGGVSLFGGRGTILGIVLGAALLDCVDNVLVLVNAPETIFRGILGAVVILAVVLNNLVSRREVS